MPHHPSALTRRTILGLGAGLGASVLLGGCGRETASPTVAGPSSSAAAEPVTVPSDEDLRDQRNQSAMRKIRESLANAGSGTADIYFVGDSLTEGFFPTTYDDCWVEIARRALQHAFNIESVPGGVVYRSPMTEGIGGPVKPVVLANVLPLTAGNVPVAGADPNGYGFGLRYVVLDAASETATLSFFGDGIGIFTTRHPGTGTMRFVIDGGAPTDVNTANASLTSSVLGFLGLIRGQHSIQVSWLRGGPVILDGFLVSSGDTNSGVRTWNGGHAGMGTANFAAASGRWMDLAINNSTINPDLVVITLGTNDSVNTVTAAAYETNMRAIVAKIRAASPAAAAASILFFMLPRRGGITDVLWQSYIDACQLVATDMGCAVLDVSKKFPSPNAASPFGDLYVDDVHPNNAGHRAIAQEILGYLGVRAPAKS